MTLFILFYYYFFLLNHFIFTICLLLVFTVINTLGQMWSFLADFKGEPLCSSLFPDICTGLWRWIKQGHIIVIKHRLQAAAVDKQNSFVYLVSLVWTLLSPHFLLFIVCFWLMNQTRVFSATLEFNVGPGTFFLFNFAQLLRKMSKLWAQGCATGFVFIWYQFNTTHTDVGT